MPESGENKPVVAPQVQVAPGTQEIKPEKKEKTTKGMTNLILEQIRSLIEINVALNSKAKELTNQQDSIEKNIKKIEDSVKGFDERISKIETNMEKFIGLYEIVTNKYNPFLDPKDKGNFKSVDKDVFEGIDLNKLREDSKKVILDIRKKQGIGTDGKVVMDPLTSEIDETAKKVPTDVKFPEEELSGAKIEKPTLDTFGNAKKSIDQPQENNQTSELEQLSSKFQFILKDGRLIKTLPELTAILDDMSDDVFNHHVNSEKNDFYEWIKHSIDKDIAENIKSEKTKAGLKVKLIEHINSIQKK